MNRLLCFVMFSLSVSLTAVAQPDKLIEWEFTSAEAGDRVFDLSFKVVIAPGYHIYGMEATEGPMPLAFKFTPDVGYELSGTTTADAPTKEKFDEGFEVNVRYYDGVVTFRQRVALTGDRATVRGIVSYQLCSDEQCIPGSRDFEFTLSDAAASSTATSAAADVPSARRSLAGFVLLALFLGLLGVATPCVFPIIPMTVSFFMTGSARKAVVVGKGVIFGLSVMLLYTLVGVIVALTQNDAFAQTLATHWLPNALFFVLFVAFALSFLGLFDISLPSSLAGKADRQADRGGYLASFFLAITLAVVSFSCTGPFVGTLLVESARDGVALKPILGMAAFGFGLGLPFMLFSFSPSLMKRLPKSGGWLNAVKVVFAFVLLGLSFKFLDVVDNYFSLGIVTRDVVVALWTTLSALVGLYLLGKLWLSHDAEVTRVGVVRLLLAIVAFTFALYLLPGLFGAPLSAVSGLIPAQEKQVFDLAARQPDAAGNVVASSQTMRLPDGITGVFDFGEGQRLSKEQGKPLFLDFKGHNCSSCKRMEKGVFRDPRIVATLNEHFVVVGLYNDDNTPLSDASRLVGDQGRPLTTVGEATRHIEASLYGTVATPYFVIADADGRPLLPSRAYTSDADAFLQWLLDGIAKWKSQSPATSL
jgi:thiol:disulfide interchange protein DsbD